MKEEKMHWIESAGGPLVLVPRSILEEWHGATQGGADYDAACMVEDYTGIIRWHGASVLVLNDEPLPTSILEDGSSNILIRWKHAPNESAILEALPNLNKHLHAPCEEVAMEVREQELALFDAGADGACVMEKLRVDLLPGRYLVQTHVFKPSNEIGLLVHVFVRKEAASESTAHSSGDEQADKAG